MPFPLFFVLILSIFSLPASFRNTVAKNVFQTSEELWEGSFALIACIMITIMALAMLKSQDMQEKWRGKLSAQMNNIDTNQSMTKRSGKYALLILPMITVLREGLEAMIFVGGVSQTKTVFFVHAQKLVPPWLSNNVIDASSLFIFTGYIRN